MDSIKPIEGFPNYVVDNLGNVFSLKKNVMLKAWKINGYYAVGLYDKGKRFVFLIHRLVAMAFIANTENKQQVDHINGKIIDNRVVNLRWVTPKENSNNPITINKLKRKLKETPHYAAIGLAQYDLKGCLIKTYVSYAEAKGDGFLRKGICKNLQGITSNYNGYIWKLL